MDDSTDPARSGDGFDDPTAPAWASPPPAPPTQPLPSGPPVTPPTPYAAPDAGPAPDPWAPAGQPPYPPPPQDGPYGSTPYGAAPYGQPGYGQPGYGPPGYVQQPYGSTAYGQSPYALPPAPYGAPPPTNTALALTIVSAIATVLCCLFCLPSLIIGIIALSKQATDPVGAAKLTRWGWIVLGIMLAVAVVAVVAFFGLGAASGAFDSGSYDYEGT